MVIMVKIILTYSIDWISNFWIDEIEEGAEGNDSDVGGQDE